MRVRRTLAIALTLAVAAGLTACGGGSGDTTTTPDTGGSAAAGFPRQVTHDKGITTVPNKPQRIVALDNSLQETVVLLGSPLVGGIAEYRDQKVFPEYLGDAVKDTKDVGPLDSPSLELIATLKPDLILSATVRHESLYDKLAAIAPTVFVATTGPIWKDNVKLVGQAIGAEQQATEHIAAYEARAKRVGDAINAKYGNPTVAVVRFLDGPTRVYLPRTFSGIILADAGLTRPANQRDPEEFNLELSEETIEQADADIMFVTTYSGGEAMKSKFYANPLWSRLAAVQKKQVYEVPDEIWMTSVSVQGAHLILDDMARLLGVDPAK